MIGISAPTDWITDLGTFRAVSMSTPDGGVVSHVSRLNPGGAWQGYASVAFGPEENYVIGFDRWRVHVTGYVPDMDHAYPSWLDTYGPEHTPPVRATTATDWHVTYDRAAGEGFAWHRSTQPGDAARFTVDTDGDVWPLVVFDQADRVPADAIAGVTHFVSDVLADNR